jgi:hypothetical protein
MNNSQIIAEMQRLFSQYERCNDPEVSALVDEALVRLTRGSDNLDDAVAMYCHERDIADDYNAMLLAECEADKKASGY